MTQQLITNAGQPTHRLTGQCPLTRPAFQRACFYLEIPRLEIYLKSHVYQQPKGVKIIINFVYNSKADFLAREKILQAATANALFRQN